MNAPAPKPRRSRLSSPLFYIPLGLGLVAFVSYLLFAHPFLAVTKRVQADILVVEGWIPAYMMPPTASEFTTGKYTLLLVSGIQNDPAAKQADSLSEAQKTAARLVDLGIPAGSIMPCPAPFTTWMRTASSARAVREKIASLNLAPKGINVVTAGPHARETWVAYQHAFGATTPIGIISIPKNNYPADRWWLTSQGWLWVTKDFIAWIKESLIGKRA